MFTSHFTTIIRIDDKHSKRAEFLSPFYSEATDIIQVFYDLHFLSFWLISLFRDLHPVHRHIPIQTNFIWERAKKQNWMSWQHAVPFDLVSLKRFRFIWSRWNRSKQSNSLPHWLQSCSFLCFHIIIIIIHPVHISSHV